MASSNIMDLVKLQTHARTALMLVCGKGLNVKAEPSITSVYGLKNTTSKKSEKYYAEQRKKALDLLGHRYVLSRPMPRIKHG